MPSLIYAPVLYSHKLSPRHLIFPCYHMLTMEAFWLVFLGVRAAVSGDERVYAAHCAAPIYLEAQAFQLHLR